jgi:hypothetical protein
MDTLICVAMLAAAVAFVGIWAAGQVRAVRRHRAGGAR